MKNFRESQEEFEKWQDQWEKAMQDIPEPVKPVSSSIPSFFGPVDVNPVPLNEVDLKYWKKLAKIDGNFDDLPTLLEQEKAEAEALKQSAQAIAQSPNPINPNSVGKDQDITQQSLSQTFTDEDIENLSELKLQLHNAQCLLNSQDAFGKDGKTQESKIKELKTKIDELSDAMGRVWPNLIGQRGD